MGKELEDFLRRTLGINAHVINMGEVMKPHTSPKKICDLTPEEIASMEVISAKVAATHKRFKEESAKLRAEHDMWWLEVQKAHNTYAHGKMHIDNGVLYEGLKQAGCPCGECK